MNKLKNIYLVLIFISTIFISVGYAAINSITGNITGNLIAKAKEGIHITDVSYLSNIDADSENSVINNFYETTLDSSIILSDTNGESTITYKVTMYNNTDYNYGFNEVLFLEENYDNTDITYDLTFPDGETILSNDDLTFNITFKYVDDTVGDSNTLNSYINISFKRIYNITYVGITNNNYPTEILEGNNLSITFIDDIPDNITVTGSENYTYDSPNLVINSVSNDITITGTQTVVPGESQGIEFIKTVFGDETNYNANGLYVDGDGSLYFAGSETVNNYVQFGSDTSLWRIISIDETAGTIKIMRNYDTALKGMFDNESSDWATSTILSNLNTWYTDNLSSYSNIIVQSPNWEVSYIEGTDLTTATLGYIYTGSPIGTFNLVEFTKSDNGSSWMEEKYQWAMAEVTGKPTKAIRVNVAKLLSSDINNESTYYRPVVYLNSSVTFVDGIGTEGSPFVIE